MRSNLNACYSRISASDIPIIDNMFGNDCLSKLKEMGDIDKYPIIKTSAASVLRNMQIPAIRYMPQYGQGVLNFRHPFPRREGQGNRFVSLRGGYRPRFQNCLERPLMGFPMPTNIQKKDICSTTLLNQKSRIPVKVRTLNYDN